jgi:hypothetical protein
LVILFAQVECLALLGQVSLNLDIGGLDHSRFWPFTEKEKLRSNRDLAFR